MSDPATRPICWVLDERMFRQLCAGEVVHVFDTGGQAVDLILAGIGMVQMLRAVLDGTLPEDIAARGKT